MAQTTNATAKRVVIIGGGFAGLYVAKGLAGKDVQVVLIDRRNHHTFQPLLYQVATTVLSPGQIASPLRKILRGGTNIEVLLDQATGFDLETKRVRLEASEELSYDYLVVAAGASHDYFGHPEWEKYAPGLKSIEDATEIRRRILLAFELSEREAFLGLDQPPLNFAVIGGGPTGVELAGAIADIARRAVAKEYRSTDTRKARVLLFEAADRILGGFEPEISAKATRQLGELGVEVRTGSPVQDIRADAVFVDGEWIPVRVMLWASGVRASPLGKQLGAALDRSGRVLVEADLSLPGHPEVFVLGDMAFLRDVRGVVVPGLGAAATQEGAATAKNILKELRGRSRKPLRYLDKGLLATIGRNRAVAQFGKLHVSGMIAWLLWAGVHLFLIIGFRNRVSVFWDWSWTYLTFQNSAPLITGEDKRPNC